MITVADIVALLVILIAFMVSWFGVTLAINRLASSVGKMAAFMVSYAAMVASYMLSIQLLVVLEVLW